MSLFVFFDAGNTLVFPVLEKTLAPLHAAGFAPTQDQLYAAERFAKKQLDAAMAHRQPGQSVDHDYWSVYYTKLIAEIGAAAELIPACVASTRNSSHWVRLLPGTVEVLDELKSRGRRLAVISNSDGGIADALRSAGLGDEYFESYTDSGNVKVEKPDRGIFEIAAKSMGARPEECVFIGDTYSVDIAGAEAAGWQGILMDPAGVYRNDPYTRVESLRELLPLL